MLAPLTPVTVANVIFGIISVFALLRTGNPLYLLPLVICIFNHYIWHCQ